LAPGGIADRSAQGQRARHQVLTEARQRFSGCSRVQLLSCDAQREAKHPQQAIVTFEEALNEAQVANDEVLNAVSISTTARPPIRPSL